MSENGIDKIVGGVTGAAKGGVAGLSGDDVVLHSKLKAAHDHAEAKKKEIWARHPDGIPVESRDNVYVFAYEAIADVLSKAL
ncbi:hypothetical protein ACWD6P_19595 [Streptomyces sp. NPDC002446]